MSRSRTCGRGHRWESDDPDDQVCPICATGVDSLDESPDSRLPGHVLVDARVGYKWAKHWSVELSGANLVNKRYENAVGYDAPRRSLFLNVRFEAF